MKSELLLAITQLAAEKNLPKEVVLRAVEAALVSAFRKEFAPNQSISASIVPQSGEIKVYAQKRVVEQLTAPRHEILLEEARKYKEDAQIDDVIEVESTPKNAGRIAAQIAKQVVLQRLREAERDAIFAEYADKEGDVVTGIVQRIEPKQIIVDLGRTEAILPASEQVPTERYRVGQRLKLYLLEIHRDNRASLVVSRTHRNLLRRLFELEVPEIYNGTVELKAIAREAGYRSKAAVAAHQENVDAVGCCVGLRGIRIQNITKELNGEKIDIVQWHPDPAVFIANALSPAPVMSVEINEEERAAVVVVPDRQLSLAIGKEGQNARLAARLVGWRIDIKSASVAEAERAERLPAEQEAVSIAEPEKEVVSELPVVPSLPSLEEEAEPEVPLETTEPLPVTEIGLPLEEVLVEAEKQPLRFAEDLFPKSIKPDTKSRKDKRKGGIGEGKEAGRGKIRKAGRQSSYFEEEESEDY